MVDQFIRSMSSEGRRLALLTVLGAGVVVGAAAYGQRGDGTPPPYLPDVKSAPGTLPAKAPLTPEQAAALAASQNVQMPPGLKPQTPAVPHEIDFSFVRYDEPGDGLLWALGKTYKCSFGPDGFTIIPFLGSDAPQNYPVKFTLAGLEAAGQSLQLGAGQVTREGDRVVIDRGIVQEVYLLTPESVEQQFIFSTKPASGDVTIQLGLESELTASDIGTAIQFGNELGGFTYSKAVTVDAQAKHTDTPTILRSANRLDLVLPKSLLSGAAYPITVDPTLNIYTAGGSAGSTSDTQSDIAYDSDIDGYTIVWERPFSATDRDIYSERYGFGGGLVAGSLVTIDFTGLDWRKPRVANANIQNEYLVVAERGAVGARQVVGRTRDAGSNTMSAQFQISDGTLTGEQFDPDVGGDPFDTAPVFWLVVWQRNFSATDTDILGRLVDTATSAVSGGTIFIENTGSSLYSNPSMSKSNNTGEWNVVYQHTFDATDEDIFGAHINWNGAINDANYLIDFSGLSHVNPAVSGNISGGAYMIVYQEDPAGSGDIRATVFDGTTYQDDVNLTTLEGDVDSARRNPAIDSNSTHFVVSSEQQFFGSDWDLYMSSMCYTGSIRLSEQHRNLDFSISATTSSQVAGTFGSGDPFDPDEFSLTWDRGGEIQGSYGVARNSCCLADIAPDPTGNNIIDVNDLLGVVTTWGDCADIQFCTGDINGDFTVNVNDLLGVITTWGPCP